jgi:hypothetical protein
LTANQAASLPYSPRVARNAWAQEVSLTSPGRVEAGRQRSGGANAGSDVWGNANSLMLDHSAFALDRIANTSVGRTRIDFGGPAHRVPSDGYNSNNSSNAMAHTTSMIMGGAESGILGLRDPVHVGGQSSRIVGASLERRHTGAVSGTHPSPAPASSTGGTGAASSSSGRHGTRRLPSMPQDGSMHGEDINRSLINIMERESIMSDRIPQSPFRGPMGAPIPVHGGWRGTGLATSMPRTSTVGDESFESLPESYDSRVLGSSGRPWSSVAEVTVRAEDAMQLQPTRAASDWDTESDFSDDDDDDYQSRRALRDSTIPLAPLQGDRRVAGSRPGPGSSFV